MEQNEPASESLVGEWTKDEHGIPYFSVYPEELDELVADIVDQPDVFPIDEGTWERFDGIKQSPAGERNTARRLKVLEFQLNHWNRIFPWMQHPLLHYITSFWVGLVDDGPREMLTPRFGGITFGWLNDGFKPTVWHTVWGLFHDQDDPWTAIYTKGAPRSRKEAEQLDRQWERERRQLETAEATFITARYNMEDY